MSYNSPPWPPPSLQPTCHPLLASFAPTTHFEISNSRHGRQQAALFMRSSGGIFPPFSPWSGSPINIVTATGGAQPSTSPPKGHRSVWSCIGHGQEPNQFKNIGLAALLSAICLLHPLSPGLAQVLGHLLGKKGLHQLEIRRQLRPKAVLDLRQVLLRQLN